MSGMVIEYRRIGELVAYENNPRAINDEAVERVASSIKEFGFRSPIIIDSNDVIIAGHTRLRASKKLGLEEVPTIRAERLTAEQVRAFRIVDNRTADAAFWDEELLDEILQELRGTTAIDFESFGFEPAAELEAKEEGEKPYNVIVSCVTEQEEAYIRDLFALGPGEMRVTVKELREATL